MRSTSDAIRVAIADDSRLIYSDDYRYGWVKGFQGIGCEVKVFDVSQLRQFMAYTSHGPYSAGRSGMIPKQIARDIAAWGADVMFAHHGRAASVPTFLDELNREQVRTAVYLCDEPYESGETCGYSSRFSAVFTMDWCTAEAHKKSRDGRSGVFYLPPGVDTDHFKLKSYHERKTTALFLGNAGLIPRKNWLKPVERLIHGAEIKFWPGRQAVYKGHKDWISYQDHPHLYSDCIVGLNVHRDPRPTVECYKKRVLGRRKTNRFPAGITPITSPPSFEGTGFWNEGNLPASHVNPRFLEMAACGTLVVSDNHRSELARMFPCAPQASDPEHFIELIQHYLDHPEEAQEIGSACSYRISARHSYRHRAAEVLIRLGLKESGAADLLSSLGAPEDWLTPQDLTKLAARSSSEATGPSGRWSPAYGLALISGSGSQSVSDSIDAPVPWLL